MKEKIEIWKDIKGYEGLYQVSNKGNVKSFKRSLEGFILKPQSDGCGYLHVRIYNKDGGSSISIHKLVALNFLNHKPMGYKFVIDHINNNNKDNRVENLQIVSHRINITKDRKNKTSKYSGVYWAKANNKWRSSTTINRKAMHLGYFEDEFEAYMIYMKSVKYRYLFKGVPKLFREILNNIKMTDEEMQNMSY